MGNRRSLEDVARRTAASTPSVPLAAQPEPTDSLSVPEQEDTTVGAEEEVIAQDHENAPEPEEVTPAPQELPPPVVQASAYPRIDLLKAKLAEFKSVYPTNAAMTPAQTAAMVRHIEMCINIMVNTTTYTETAMALSELRSAFFANENNVFSKARILGNMIEPRSGRPVVANGRTMTLTSLIYITMNPKTFMAQKGRIDVASSVVGLPENIANNIIQYYS